MTQNRPAKSAIAQTDSGLGLVHVDGLMHARAVSELLERTHEYMNLHELPALVADYSLSVIDVDPDAMLRSVQLLTLGEMGGGLLEPAALIVPSYQVEMMQTYASMMCAHGAARAVFTCREKALSWASRQAELRAAQRAHRLLARISRSS